MSPYIAKTFRFLKGAIKIWLIFFLLGLPSCKPPEFVGKQLEKLPPQALERLARLPYLGAYLVPQVAPDSLKDKAQKGLRQAQLAGAPRYAPQLFNKAVAYFAQGTQYYQKKRFLWAKYYFKKALETSQKALQKSEKVRQQAQKIRRTKLQKLLTLWEEVSASLPEDQHLEINLKIKELELMIEEEQFKEFDQKWHALWENLQQIKTKKGGNAPP